MTINFCSDMTQSVRVCQFKGVINGKYFLHNSEDEAW